MGSVQERRGTIALGQWVRTAYKSEECASELPDDGLGAVRGLMLAAELSAAFWIGVGLLIRAVW